MNIYEKLSEVMKAVRYLSKDGRIDYKETHYKAISEAKVTSTVREQLIAQGLVIFPVEQEHSKAGNLTTVNVRYRIVNIENPEEFIEVVSSGTGADTQDKGVGKAMTYAYKYMLLRTFAIPTGEDPDQVSSAQLDDEMAREAQKAEAAKTSQQAATSADQKPASKAMKKVIVDKCRDHRINLDAWLATNGLQNVDQLTAAQAACMINTLKERYGDE